MARLGKTWQGKDAIIDTNTRGGAWFVKTVCGAARQGKTRIVNWAQKKSVALNVLVADPSD